MQKKKKTETGKAKAEAARARKNAEAERRKAIEAREKEDKYWQEAEGNKPRSAMKREEKAKKREEVAARKAETRRLAEVEEMEIDKNLKKKLPPAKVTEVELRLKREEEQASIRKKVEENKWRQSRMTAEEEYKRTVLVENTNRNSSIIDARTIEEAISVLTMAVAGDPIASFKAFARAEVRRLKEEKAGLTIAQYNDMVSKLWKRSHLNPVNQKNTDAWKKSDAMED